MERAAGHGQAMGPADRAKNSPLWSPRAGCSTVLRSQGRDHQGLGQHLTSPCPKLTTFPSPHICSSHSSFISTDGNSVFSAAQAKKLRTLDSLFLHTTES